MNAPERLNFLVNVLADLGKHLRRWRLLTALTASLFGFLAFMVIFQMVAYFFPMREAVAINLFMIIAVSSLILTGFYIMRVVKDQPALSALACRIELHNPDLYDHLNCAVDISLKDQHSLSAIEQLVITKADDALQTIDVYQAAGYDRDQKHALLAALLIGILLLGSLGQWPATENLYHALKDKLSGENTGLSVEPGSAEFPEHSDIKIRANIHRGLKQASIEYQIGDSRNQASMYSLDDRNDQVDFTFFDAVQPIDYRVKTPDFSSEWYHLSIYSIPNIDTVSWWILPPAYTQLPETQHTNVKHIAVPEGSRILPQVTVLQVKAPQAAASDDFSVEMVTQYDRIPLMYKDKLYQQEWLPPASSARANSRDDLIVYFHAENRDGRSAQTESTTIDIVVDEKPVLEIVSPGVDVSLKSDDTAILELYLADDYGLSKASLNVAINDVKKDISLTLQKDKNDQRQHLPLVMTDFDAKPGDLITYYLAATDNKQPQAQAARSEIFFIEIGNEDDDSEKPMQDGEALNPDTDKKELPIREFIVKTKQIIRQSFAIIDNAVEEEKAQTLKDIAQDTLVLKQAMNNVYVKNKASFQIVENIDTGNLLLEAVRALERSIIELDRQAIQPSIDNTSVALQRLVQLDSLFRRLAASQGMAKGSLAGLGETGDSLNKISQPSNHEKRLEKMNATREALQKTQALIEQQQHLNIRIDNAGRLPSGTQLALAGRQQEIEQQTAELSHSLYDATGKLSVVTFLQQAGKHMQSSQEFLTKKQETLASPQGVRAMESLQMAAVNLKRELYALADETLAWTKTRGEQLAEQQYNSIENTRQGAGAQQLQKEQESLNSAINQYSTDIQQTSRLLRDLNEAISQSMGALNSSAQRTAMERHQNRAVNALLYELFEQAEKEQQQIYESLQHLTTGIESVRQSLAGEKGNVLAGTVQSIDDVLKNMKQMSAENLQALARQLAGQLQDGSITESDFRLKEAVDLFEVLGHRQDAEYLKQDMEWALQQTKSVLQAQLWQKAIRQSIQQSREKTQLPHQYRRAVEDYFRRLAEESR